VGLEKDAAVSSGVLISVPFGLDDSKCIGGIFCYRSEGCSFVGCSITFAGYICHEPMGYQEIKVIYA
jgi:hypothetical protein